jgi:two-component system chemotaxis response regulator CheY
MHALVIDDSRATRRILRQILEKLGFEVSEAGDGREGLAHLARQGGVELALVDRNMPDMDGLEFIRAVRADGRYRDLRLVMVTTEEELAGARQAGADGYLGKPFTREALREQLQRLGVAPA